MTAPAATAVTALVVAYGPDPWLERCVQALLASRGVAVDVVLVDNGHTGDAVAAVADCAGVQVVRPGANLGFAEGCNRAARSATGEVVALVNPDVIVEPDTLARLAAVASEPTVAIATASLRLGEAPDTMNSAGNPVHYLGLAWAGGHGEPAAQHASRVDVASASGACCALTRSLWTRLGGFEPAYFAYHEDVELSLRCWQQGLRVSYVPDAVAVHHYEFARNAFKNELLERNRWLTLLTVFSARTLLLIAPALVVFEVLMLALATKQGWLRAKLVGYRWLLGHGALIRARRARVQRDRVSSDREVAKALTGRLEPSNVGAVPGLAVLNLVLNWYWQGVRRAL